MRFASASASAFAFALAGFCAPAQAVTIDFTDRSVWSSAASTDTVAGALVTLSSDPAGQINFNQDFDGAPAASPFCAAQGGSFACVSDGLGVRDDEISTVPQFTETVTITFSTAVRILAFHFLDLFIASSGASAEVAHVAYNLGGVTESHVAVEVFNGSRPGFRTVAATSAPAAVTSITFTADLANDELGRADFALAGIDVAAIPLPAAGWLLAGAIGGLAALRRTRAKAA